MAILRFADFNDPANTNKGQRLEELAISKSKSPDNLLKYMPAFFSPSTNKWLAERCHDSDYKARFMEYSHSIKQIMGLTKGAIIERAAYIKNAADEVILGYLEQHALMNLEGTNQAAITTLMADYDFLIKTEAALQAQTDYYGLDIENVEPEIPPDIEAFQERLAKHIETCKICDCYNGSINQLIENNGEREAVKLQLEAEHQFCDMPLFGQQHLIKQLYTDSIEELPMKCAVSCLQMDILHTFGEVDLTKHHFKKEEIHVIHLMANQTRVNWYKD